MERIRLTKQEKTVLRLLASGCNECPDAYPRHIFVSCIRSLEQKGLAKGAWQEGGEMEDARLTPFGREYLAENPSLRNPVDWRWVITTAIATVAALASIVALFVSCSLLNK